MNTYLRLLYSERDSVLIGGKNVVYNVSLKDLSEITEKRIVWEPNRAHIDMCTLKGRTPDDCNNYIKIGVKLSEQTLYICGTNAYKPQCQKYDIKTEPYITQTGMDGKGKCPYDPKHNSTFVLTDGHLFTATVADFTGGDPVIYREPLLTERSDLKQLNEPNFVDSVAYKEYVMFFFREPAVEYINCGKTIYSRVGRVCKNDKGGPHAFKDRWTSFLKSRLNCSVPGDYPFYFNEIQSVSDIVEGSYGGVEDELIYGVFNTPMNSIGGSAVCAYSMRSILATFDGPFKEQEHMNANWMSVPSYKVPIPRPGHCVNDSRTLPDMTINFSKTHSLMDEAVPAYHSHPVFISTAWQYKISSIAVDPQIRTVSGGKVDMLFLGTDDGRILKVACIIGKTASDVKTVVIEELQVLPNNESVTKLSIIRPTGLDAKLLIISNTEVHALPLQRCATKTNCIDCVSMQDPYCAWNTSTKQCITIAQDLEPFHMKYVLQNISSGEHKVCPPPQQQQQQTLEQTSTESKILDNSIDNEIKIFECPVCTECNTTPCVGADEEDTRSKIAVIYTADSISLMVVLLVLVTLIFGFIAGCFCSRRFCFNSFPRTQLCSSLQHNRLTETSSNGEAGSTILKSANGMGAAGAGSKSNPLNIVVNVSNNFNEKNTTTTADTKTLQKVKKTYI